MNEYDSELVKAILIKRDYVFTQDEQSADIIMLNTCAIREHAHRKIYGRIQRIHHERNKLNEHNKHKKPVLIGILGCMATNLRTDLLENPHLKIDFIAGPDSYKRLPDLIREAGMNDEKPFDLTLSEFETYSDVYPQRGQSPFGNSPPGVNAWVAVMRGCNNFCTFCVVPYTRGRERSRSVDNVVEEVRRLADEGFKQVTLLGQNVNSYKHEGKDFADLMEAVSRVEGIKRIRFTSPHPKDFPDKFLDVMANNPKVCKQIHLPLQSGSTRILDKMNRTYTKEEFLDLANHIRERVPGVALSTDVIVGFSSETDEDFAETLDVMKRVEFDSAFTFKYSERKQTIASREHPDDVPDVIKTERIVHLNSLQKEISYRKNMTHIGELQTVLVEHRRDNPKNHYAARTDTNKIVIIPAGDYVIGEFVEVRITDATPNNLKGRFQEILIYT